MGKGRYNKVLQGVVVSDKQDKTRVVLVSRTFRGILYRKVIRRSKKFHAHDEKNQTKAGDLVRIRESRPMSRLKRWRIIEVVKKT